MKKASFIWMDGDLVKWDDAKVHILSHTMHYGNGVFEGIRAYNTQNGLAIFRLNEHTKRLLDGAKILALKVKYTQKELQEAQINLLKANNFQNNAYIRPLVYLGYGAMGLSHIEAPVCLSISAWEWGTYLGEAAVENGIKARTSSFARNSIKSTLGKAKGVGYYVNSQMARYEAIKCGANEAIMLDEQGFIAEGTGECIFIVRDGTLITPPNDNSLESITQKTVIELAYDLNLKLERRRITRDEIYIADETFLTGTAAELTPIIEFDDRIIGNGKKGPITKALQDIFFDVVYGRKEKYKKYLTYIKEH